MTADKQALRSTRTDKATKWRTCPAIWPAARSTRMLGFNPHWAYFFSPDRRKPGEQRASDWIPFCLFYSVIGKLQWKQA